MKNRKLLLIVSLVLAMTMAMGGTLAYLTDTDEAVNVMTLGNVDIEQIELQRKEDVPHFGLLEDGDLEPFEQGQALYPAFPVHNATTDYSAEMTDLLYWGPYVTAESDGTTNGAGNGLWNEENLIGALDKMVFVENTGTSDAYYRTILAFECPEGMEYSEGPDKEFMMNINLNSRFDWKEVGYIKVEDVRYLVMVATYQEALKPGEISRPSLLQVVMTHKATNEDMKKLGETYEIIALTQAMQVTNFEEVKPGDALDIAFGKVEEKAAEWLGGVEAPTIFTYEGVKYVYDNKNANVTSVTGDTLYRGILSDGKTTATNVTIGEGIVRLNNRALAKAPTIASVTLPSTLTYIDESAFQQSGITEIEIPENVTYIGKQAFGACENLEKIIIKAEHVTIANYVARACANLKEVYIYSDSVTFESGSMYFTNKESGDASGITFYVGDQAMADTLFNALSTSNSYGLLIKNIDGTDTYYNTLK